MDAIEKLTADVQAFIAKSNEELEKNGSMSKATKEHLASLEDNCKDMNARLLEMEQNGTAPAGGIAAQLSAGNSFVKSDAFKAMTEGRTNKARFHIENSTVTGSDDTVAPDRQSGVIGPAQRVLRVTSVLSTGNTASNSIEYTRENTIVNNAAEVAEGGAKPETDITFTLESVPVATVAHWIKLSKQVMDDAPMLASYIDGRMRYGVGLRLDEQILNGDGTGANIGGIMKSGNHTVFTPADANVLANIRKAVTLAEASEYSPNAIILNPADVETIDLDEASDGHFRAGDPRLAPSGTVWGLPIVKSNSMTAGQFVLGAFDMGAQLWNRQGITVDLSESDGDNFQKNLVTLRAEMRAGLTVYRPAAFVGGALSV